MPMPLAGPRSSLRLSRSASRDVTRLGPVRAGRSAPTGASAGSCQSSALYRPQSRYSSVAADSAEPPPALDAASASGDSRRSWDRNPPRRSLRESTSVLLAPPGREYKESGACGLCPPPSESRPPGWVAVDRFRLAARPVGPQGKTHTLRLRCRQRSAHRGLVRRHSVWLAGTLLRGSRSSRCARRAPRTDASCPTSPSGISAVVDLADCWVPFSSHPCLSLPNRLPTGPGPSLPACFAARGLSVLQPDPPSWCHPSHFPLTVIG